MKTIEMLDAILLATKAKRLTWKTESAGRYLATGPIKVIVQEVCPLIAGDTDTAGAQAFEVNVNKVIITFWSGTTGSEKILEILAAGLVNFGEHNDLVSERIDSAIKRLKAK